MTHRPAGEASLMHGDDRAGLADIRTVPTHADGADDLARAAAQQHPGAGMTRPPDATARAPEKP